MDPQRPDIEWSRTPFSSRTAQLDGAPFARRLHDDLEKNGIDTFLDERDINEGENIELLVQSNLMRARAILAVLTPGAAGSDFVSGELFKAFEYDVPVIPLTFSDGATPTSLGALKHLDFRVDYDAAFKRLLQRLTTAGGGSSRVPEAEAADVRRPAGDITGAGALSGQDRSPPTPISRRGPRRSGLRADSGHTAATLIGDFERASGEVTRVRKAPVVGVPLADVATQFRNREAQLARLRSLIADSSTRLVTVLGRGGIGKSALVSQVLSEEGPEAPPLQGVVCLSARTRHEINAEEVFLTFGELLGPASGTRLAEAWSRPSQATCPRRRRRWLGS